MAACRGRGARRKHVNLRNRQRTMHEVSHQSCVPSDGEGGGRMKITERGGDERAGKKTGKGRRGG